MLEHLVGQLVHLHRLLVCLVTFLGLALDQVEQAFADFVTPEDPDEIFESNLEEHPTAKAMLDEY